MGMALWNLSTQVWTISARCEGWSWNHSSLEPASPGTSRLSAVSICASSRSISSRSFGPGSPRAAPAAAPSAQAALRPSTSRHSQRPGTYKRVGAPTTNLLCETRTSPRSFLPCPLFRRRPQGAVHPLPSDGIVQRIVVAIGADVAIPVSGGRVAHELHRPPAVRTRLPDRMQQRPAAGSVASLAGQAQAQVLTRARQLLKSGFRDVARYRHGRVLRELRAASARAGGKG
jgi:hypothetical protein